MSNNQAVKFVNKYVKNKYTGNIAKKLAEEAIKIGSYDNVTVCQFFFCLKQIIHKYISSKIISRLFMMNIMKFT